MTGTVDSSEATWHRVPEARNLYCHCYNYLKTLLLLFPCCPL